MSLPPPVEIDLELDGAPVLPVSLPTGQSGAVTGGPIWLAGWSLRNTSSSAAAQIDLYDGADATGQLVATITLAASESTRDYLPSPGVTCRRGVYADAVSGSVAGAVWVSGGGA